MACAIGGALLAGSVGLMIANAQQAQAPAFIAGDRPVTAEQVLEKLQTDGWSNVVISRNGRYIEVTGSMNGETGKWRSTRRQVAFVPTTTTTMTIEPDDALVLLPESARAGERRRLGPSPLDPTTAASETPQSRSTLSVFKSTECSVVRRGRRSCRVSRNAPAGDLRVCGLQRWK